MNDEKSALDLLTDNKNNLFTKIFKLETAESSIKTLLIDKFASTKENIKFIVGSDRVFIISKNKLYIFTNDELFSSKGNIDLKDKKVLFETRDFYYPKESHVIILYGKSEINPKNNCIVVYDFIKNIILHTIFLPLTKDPKGKDLKGEDPNDEESKDKGPKDKDLKDKNPKGKDLNDKDPKDKDYNTKDPNVKNPNAKDPIEEDSIDEDPINTDQIIIRAKVNQNHTISFIAVSYDYRILIYKGPFTDNEIVPSLKIILNPKASPSILLIEFGQIENEIKQRKKRQIETKDALYIITKSKQNENKKAMKMRVFLINENDPDFSNKNKITKKDFDYLADKCILLDNNTICSEYKKAKQQFIVFDKFIISDNNIIRKVSQKIKNSSSKHLTSFFGFKHYIFAYNESKLFIYDYKYIEDLNQEDYKKINSANNNDDNLINPQNNNNDQKDSVLPKQSIQCLLECVINLPLLVFHHLSRLFLLFYNDEKSELLKLSEDDPSLIINKLISSNDHFEYAKQQANCFSMSEAEMADIEWKQANFIFNCPEYDEITRTERAMDHFIKTIGFKSSSYVIQLYMNYKEETLIRYLWGDDTEKSEDRLIFNPKTSSIEHRKLLISICMNLSNKKGKENLLNKEEEIKPETILINASKEKVFNDCSEALIDALLVIGKKEDAIEIANNTHNYERKLKLLFEYKDEHIKDIIDVIFNDDLKEDYQMKMNFLNQYARELFYTKDENIDQVERLIDEISKFAETLFDNNGYIQQICLLFVPHISAVLPKLEQINLSDTDEDQSNNSNQNDNRNENQFEYDNSDQDENTDENSNEDNDVKLKPYFKNLQTKMSILFYKFYQNVYESWCQKSQNHNDNLSVVTLNNVYIQHLIILCRNICLVISNSKSGTKFEDTIFFKELKKTLENTKYDVEVAVLSIIDVPEEYIKFDMLECICLKYEEYASKLIHLVPLFKDMEDRISRSIKNLCTNFGAKNPNLYIEAIAELIRNEKYIETIPSLLEEASKYMPLPDIITYILSLPNRSLNNRKLNISLIKKYVVDWMNSMKEYEQVLKKEIEKNEKELKDISNTKYSLEQMKEIRDNYEKMINYASKLEVPNSTPSIPDLVPKRPFSTIPIHDDPKKISDNYKRGTLLPSSLLDKLEDGALSAGLDKNDFNTKNHIIKDPIRMITEFDQMFEYLNQ